MADILTVQLRARAFGPLRPEQFAVAEARCAPLRPGQALVENVYLSVGAETEHTVRHDWHLHTPMPAGPAVGRVVETRTGALPLGTVVRHDGGWSTHAVVTGGQPGLEPVELAERLPLTFQLSVLGRPGLAAWAGVREILRVRSEESLLVASALSPAGHLAGQIARLYGVQRLTAAVPAGHAAEESALSRGFDEVLDLDRPGAGSGAAAEPFDTAWTDLAGERVPAITAMLRPGARLAVLDAAGRGQAAPTGPVDSHVSVHRYRPGQHAHLRETARTWLRTQVVAKRIVPRETVVQGFENIVDVFIDVLHGRHPDPVIVQLTGSETAPVALREPGVVRAHATGGDVSSLNYWIREGIAEEHNA